eukprot:7272763-Pyramimonas_sp.AAC.1
MFLNRSTRTRKEAAGRGGECVGRGPWKMNCELPSCLMRRRPSPEASLEEHRVGTPPSLRPRFPRGVEEGLHPINNLIWEYTPRSNGNSQFSA